MLIKKVILNLMVWPSAIFWAYMCLLGLIIFAHGALRDWESLFLSFLCLSGLICLLFAVEGTICYPYVKKRNMLASVMGLILQAIGLYIGILQDTAFALTALLMCIAAVIIIYTYNKRLCTNNTL